MVKTEKKSLKVGKYVDNEHADTLIRNYKHERWVHNSERIGKEDSLSSWYTIEELEDFIETSKAHGADGIKFYFGTYPKSFPARPEYSGRQTILLVATKSKTTDAGVANKNIYVKQGDKMQILAYNLGMLCPPMCQKQSPGASHESGIGITIVDRGEKGLTLV
jgi:hypothetical protein